MNESRGTHLNESCMWIRHVTQNSSSECSSLERRNTHLNESPNGWVKSHTVECATRMNESRHTEFIKRVQRSQQRQSDQYGIHLQRHAHGVSQRKTLQHSAKLCNTLEHSATLCNTLLHSEHFATHGNTRQQTATHCNTYGINLRGVRHPHAAPWLIRMWEMTHSYMEHDLWAIMFWYVVWFDEYHTCMLHYALRMSLESCHTYQWVTSHMSMSHVTHINEARHTYQCVTSHISMRHVAHINAARHTYQCGTSHISMCHVTHTNASRHTYQCVTSHISMRHVTHISTSHVTLMNESRHTYQWHT